nr:protein-serine O-palmitoleoyltransferase porcupine [Leptinotarsa decemlineata]
MDEPEDLMQYFYENEESYEETLSDVWNHCIGPSTASISHLLFKIILVNLVFGTTVSAIKLPEAIFHILSGVSGVYLISILESTEGKIIFLGFFSQTYLLLRIGLHIKRKYDPDDKVHYLRNSNLMKYNLLAFLVLCEYILLETNTWMEIRGIVMIFSMKLISLVEDVEKGVIVFPSIVGYFGYFFCGANIMFGPWISFQDYLVLYHQNTKKTIWWLVGVVRALVTSLLFLTISNCWISYFIKDGYNRWILSYKEALSFRTSHYFICYLSEASMLAAGFKNSKIWNNPDTWRFVVTDPSKIEFPPALAIVVTNWNRPMHDFLKKCKSQNFVQKFY